MEKITYVDAINSAIAMFSAGGQIDAEDAVVVEKLEALKTQLEKRGSGNRKPTKTQLENESLKEDIFAYVSENGQKRAGEVAAYFGLSNQKASAMLKQLVESGRLEKCVETCVHTFRVAKGY